MNAPSRRQEVGEAIRARLLAPLPRLESELQRVDADIHSLRNAYHRTGLTRRRFRRLAIHGEKTLRSLASILLPAATFPVALRQIRQGGDAERNSTKRPLRFAIGLLPASSRDRWAEEWQGEIILLKGLARLRWKLSTLRAIVRLAYVLRRPTGRDVA